MNPVIVIPSCWDRSARPGALGERGVYDYTTPIDKPLPELEVCLSSLEGASFSYLELSRALSKMKILS